VENKSAGFNNVPAYYLVRKAWKAALVSGPNCGRGGLKNIVNWKRRGWQSVDWLKIAGKKKDGKRQKIIPVNRGCNGGIC